MRTQKPFVSLTLAALAGSIGVTGWVAARASQPQTPTQPPRIPLVTGKFISPTGTQTNVGSYPHNAIISPDGKYMVVTSLGARTQLSVLSTETGALVSKVEYTGNSPVEGRRREGLFYGLAWGPETEGGRLLYVGRGADDRAGVLVLDSAGKLTRSEKDIAIDSDWKRELPDGKTETIPLYIAGIALNSEGTQLYAACNNGNPNSRMNSVLQVVDVPTGVVLRRIPVEGYPLAVVAKTAGSLANRKVYVGSEQRGTVEVVDTELGRVTQTLNTGNQVSGLLLNNDQTRLYVANAGSDTISVVDTDTDKVLATVLLRPVDARDVPGTTPQGMCLSPDGKTLFVALSDMNAVAVVDVKENKLKGYIPAGWYPTAVQVSPDGKKLLIVNAKGVGVRNPNGEPVPIAGSERPQYIQNIIEGTVSTMDLAPTLNLLTWYTSQVLTNNRVRPDMVKVAREALKNPGIEHVIYIIKENRTYDQVLSDISRGNGDTDLLMFGREVTPNQHAFADRFVLLDNFYCCAEVSGDGWNWSTSGMVSPYNSRNVVYGYTGKVRTYDYEGANNNVPVDLLDIPDVNKPAGGYIWDNCARSGVSMRNYGFFMTFGENQTNKKALVGKTCDEFLQYNMDYADSEAWVKYGLQPAPRQIKEYGKYNDPSRMTAWLREFNQFVEKKNLPKFMMVRLGRDHTSGTSPGTYSPRAMVADNDYAVGQLVEAVSKSPYWEKTAIFIVEDDAQNGYDHVDAHRSIAFAISPYIRRATKDSRFYNTDSVIRTMELLLGMPPLNQYTAGAVPYAFFTDKPENNEPYTAILPAKEIVSEINSQRAYRAQDSLALLNPLKEESAPDEELNDILWHSIKGVNVPAPPRRYTLRTRPTDEDDD
ncbi:MAG: alkaline phosphatase family protein [Armatimonadaceae bacterium]